MSSKNNILLVKEMGFNCSSFSETIVIIGTGNKYRITPLGLRLCGNNLIARIYKNTRLYSFLKKLDKISLSICVTSNPILFYKAVLYKDKLEVEDNDRSTLPRLKGCDAYITGYVDELNEDSSFLELVISIERVHYQNSIPKTVVRANYAIIEALVYLTKIPYIDQEGKQELYKRILWCQDIVYHSTKDRGLRSIIDDIVEKAKHLSYG